MENQSLKKRSILMGFLDTPALSALLDVAEGTLANWRWRGIGPRWIKVGGLVRYRESDVEEWLDSQAQGGNGGAAA